MDRNGVTIYSCKMPDGSDEKFDMVTVWDAKAVELSGKGIRIRSSKNMICGVTRGRVVGSEELLCPQTI